MLIAWLKLRQRTLGPVLDATGWAVNGRVRVNLPLGAALPRRVDGVGALRAGKFEGPPLQRPFLAQE